jgi:predicted glycosyltransferase
MSGPSVFFYVQHLLGIGHLARASRIARAIMDYGMTVTLVTGGMPVAGFPDADIPHIALPPVAAGDAAFKGLLTPTGLPADDAYLSQRKAMLLNAFHAAKPDIVMIEAFPFGRKQMRFELLPLLDAVASAHPRPALVTSLRDILQRRGRADRDQETVDIVRNHFDLVLIHGDPTFAAFGDSFPFADQIADRVVYTGLVVPPPPLPTTEHFDVIVSAGGGAVGKELISAAFEASALMPDLKKWCIITGPNLPQAEFDTLSEIVSPNVTLVRFRPDLASLMTGTRLSVSQAGYNTVGDILQSGCNALVVPYAEQGETEQTDRATRLSQIGRVAMLNDADLSGSSLVAAIRLALKSPIRHNVLPIAINGAARTAQLLSQLRPGSIGDRF